MRLDLSVRSNSGLDYSQWIFRLAANQWFAHLALVVALVFAVWVASTLFWRLAFQDSGGVPGDAGLRSHEVVARVQQRQWFGAPISAIAAEGVRSNIRLRGLIAERGDGQSGVAIFSVDGGPERVVAVGEEIAPGVRLQRVEPGTVVVSRGGRDEHVEVPKRGRP